MNNDMKSIKEDVGCIGLMVLIIMLVIIVKGCG